MTISVPTFLAVVLVTIGFLLPSVVAILAILLTDRGPSYLQTFALCVGWLVSLAVFLGTAFVLPWSPDYNVSFGLGVAVFVTAVANVVAASFAGHRLYSADYRFRRIVSGMEPARTTTRR